MRSIDLSRLTAAALTLILFALPTAALAQAPQNWQRAFPQTDFAQHAVPFDEIRSGGVPKDGIPSIDDPNTSGHGDVLTDAQPR